MLVCECTCKCMQNNIQHTMYIQHMYIYMYLHVYTTLCIPECYIPYWILVSMVTDQTRPFVDVPEPNGTILGRRQQILSLVVETHAIYGTVVPKQGWDGGHWCALVTVGHFGSVGDG